MLLFTDQLLHASSSTDPLPRRIISLVPSLTELLYDLGLDEEVVGITKFCVHPEHWFRNKTRIGGTKNIKIGKIHELQPGLIIANKEENLREDVEELALHYPVWVTDIHTLKDALEMIRVMGRVTGRVQKAESIVQTIEKEFTAPANELSESAAYFIWRNPYMVAGGGTFIHQMMRSCGLRNVFQDRNRYPVITIEELRAAGCECILLSSEPYPFKEKDIEELQRQLPTARIMLVDGEMFSWYGSRMLKAPVYFRSLRDKLAAN